MRAKRKAIRDLDLKDEIEDILISLSKQYHLIRPLRSKQSLFFYVVLDRSRANLAMSALEAQGVARLRRSTSGSDSNPSGIIARVCRRGGASPGVMDS